MGQCHSTNKQNNKKDAMLDPDAERIAKMVKGPRRNQYHSRTDHSERRLSSTECTLVDLDIADIQDIIKNQFEMEKEFGLQVSRWATEVRLWFASVASERKARWAVAAKDWSK